MYRHYKGDSYKVILLAEHSNDDEWMVVYEPMYENSDAPYFTRPLREWREVASGPPDRETVIRARKGKR